MSSLWTNLLFMHGHIADPALARRLADVAEPKPRPSGKRLRTTKPAAASSKLPPATALPQGGCV
ncbi:hypothetical protein [Dyella sp. ASV21]|uniref:hypothetical protein n=1 Tax=Dyella sp. ASV21 TaxID=2795114 RepID=UPI0018EE2909|nr:hypothetical protein [Dyella sp. ASV21]